MKPDEVNDCEEDEFELELDCATDAGDACDADDDWDACVTSSALEFAT